LQNEIVVKSQEISKAQADAAETRAQAYADSKITNEEQARIRQADANLELLQQQQQSLKNEMATYTDNLINEEERARMEADKAKEEALQAKINLAQTQANAYADDKITAEEERAIADAIAKRDEAKLYADQKAQEAQEVANQNVINKLEPITTRVTTNESNITELDTQISFMAKSEDVAQELNNVYGRLTPLETTVESNKATLDILPTQIESKVSKQDYILDKNEIVQRLDNADSQRRQLSNEITDKVTITKFESGMTEAKNYTDNIKEQATIYTDNKFNNLNVGGRNLLRYSTQKYLQIPNSYCTGIVEEEGKRALLFDSSNDILYLGDKEYLIEEGEIYTFSFYAKASEELKFMRGVYINSDNNYFNKGETITTNWKRYSFTFTGKGNAPVTIYMYPAIKNADGTYKSFYITDWQLEKGTVATDVTPAPEDVETLVKKTQQDAEKATKAYADAQDNLKETKIKTYADDIVNAEEHRAIQDAESKLETAKQDAQNKANVAQQAAEDYAVIKANDDRNKR